MKFLSFSDIANLIKVAKRFQGCGKRVLEHKPFSKYDTQNSFNQALIKPNYKSTILLIRIKF